MRSLAQPVAGLARDAVKHGMRAVGLATAGLRPLPEFLVIGAKRGGSTSFYFDLIEHPSIVRLYPPPVPLLKPVATKGVHYFDSEFGHGTRWYRSYFPTTATRAVVARRTGRAITGEASPYYLFHPAAAARAHALVPQTRLIAILRDPVLRTYSHWKERRRQSAEDLDFLDALAAEPERLAGERERLLADPGYQSYPWEQQSYATQSLYAQALRPWIDLFGRDRLFVAASEDYYADPNAVLRACHEFLGLPPRSTATGQVRNAAAGQPLPENLRRALTERFAGPNEELEQLLGQRFPWG